MSAEKEDRTICPWCQTEVVWDEEIGPEKHCPYCENELSGYRTLQFGLDEADDEDDEVDEDGEAAWDDAGQLEDERRHTYPELREFGRGRLVFDETLERIIDEQEEAPECPVCREYMVEAGTQTVPEAQFAPRTPGTLKRPLVTAPLRIVWYVCPSCFHTESKLAGPEQEKFVQLLSEAADGRED